MDEGDREDAEIRRWGEVMARALEHGGLGRTDKPDDEKPAEGSKMEGDGRSASRSGAGTRQAAAAHPSRRGRRLRVPLDRVPERHS